MKDKKMFGEFILAIGEMFDKDISDVLRQLYWKALEPFTDEQCKKAFNDVILSSRFFPKPIDIIEKIKGTQSNRATEAWIQTLTAIRRIGTYRSVKFSDPVIHAVIEFMSGWPEMGNILVDDEKWKQKEFERLYPIMEARGRCPEYLPGRIEVKNSAHGFLDHIPQPVAIGFEDVKRIEEATQ
jgi:hypothetical protein